VAVWRFDRKSGGVVWVGHRGVMVRLTISWNIFPGLFLGEFITHIMRGVIGVTRISAPFYWLRKVFFLKIKH